ncbi:MAG TPA: tetratricopeptide repeat protein [Planctomycetota bacterium]|nr:tetratricopeptide repeat protein [Planctomycetota bacterium]
MSRWPLRTLSAALALAAAATPAVADPVVSWPLLQTERERHGGLFASWSIDQRKLLSAFQTLEKTGGDSDIAALRRRVEDDPVDLAATDALAVRYWRNGRFREAVLLLRRVLDLDPTFTRARLDLAEFFAELGSYQRAVRELEEGIGLQPKSASLRRFLAEVYGAWGEWRRAATAWQEVAQLVPTDPQALLHLARAWLRAGEPEAAKAVLARFARFVEGNEELTLALGDLHRALGNLRAAREIWERLLKRSARSGAVAQLGLLHLSQGEFREARQRFSEAAQLPGADAFVVAGAAAAAQGLNEQAEVISLCSRVRAAGRPHLAASLLANLWLGRGDATAIEAVWAAFPRGGSEGYAQLLTMTRTARDVCRDLALVLSQAEVLKEAGWLSQAIGLLEPARERTRASVLLSEALASCYEAAGHGERELLVREELTQARPDSVQASNALAWALIERGEWARAEGVSRAFTKRFFDDLESRLVSATVALRNGDYATAIRDCQAVSGKYPTDERLYALLLDAMLRAGEFRDGVSLIHGREGALPTFILGPLERAILAADEEHWEEALAQVQRGLRRTPRDHRLWLLAGATAERRGDLAGAAAQYQVATWVRPEHVSLHVTLARTAARAGLVPLAAEAYRTAIGQTADPFDLQLEYADALAQWGRHKDAVAVLDSLRPGTGAQRDAAAVRLAEALVVMGEPARALELARAMLARDAAEPVARRVAVLACRAQGDLDAALKICEAARAGGTADAELGILYLLKGRHKEAEERLASAVGHATQVTPRAELRRALAIAQTLLNQPQKALNTLQESLPELGKQSAGTEDLVVLLAAAGAGDAAGEFLARIAESDPTGAGWVRGALPKMATDRELAGLVLTACAARRAGWYGAAAELFALASKRAPDAPLWLREAVRAYVDAKVLDPALALARQLVASCPNTGEAHLALALVLEKQGKRDAALDAYARGAAMLSRGAVAERLAAADRLRAGGRFDAAVEAYRSVLDAQPGNRAVARELAALYAAHKPDQLAEAERLATLAAEDNAGDAACRDTLGWIHFLAKRPEAARPEILAALRSEPRRAISYYHLGMVDFVLGHKERAHRALRIALTLDADLPDAETARSTLKAIEAEKPSQETVPPAP